MTSREREILAWIEADPLISQEELAKKAGITRSSVGVHVSNLVKKGYLRGRGYILDDGTEVSVVGGVNVDIGGFSFRELVAKDSNPGRVRVTLGGVGRNIAHNLVKLDTRVRLFTAFGDDVNAERVEKSCRDLGIDVSGSLRVAGETTSTYLYIDNADGDMALAVADMDIYEKVTPDYLKSVLPRIAAAKVAVADTNIPAAALEFLAANLEIPLFVDPVSTAKAVRLKNCLSGIHTLKPNRLEAEILSGVKIASDADLPRAAAALRQKGVKRVFLSHGAKGVYADAEEGKGFFPAVKTQAKNATGAGDAFMAGLVWAYLHGLGLEETVRTATAAAAVAISSPETISEEMSVEKIRQTLKED